MTRSTTKPTKWPMRPPTTQISLRLSAQSDHSSLCTQAKDLSFLHVDSNGCPGWSESSLGAQVLLLVLSCCSWNQCGTRKSQDYKFYFSKFPRLVLKALCINQCFPIKRMGGISWGLGIRLPQNLNPQKLDRASRHWGRTFVCWFCCSASQSTTMVMSRRSVNNWSHRDRQSMSQSTTMVMLWRSVNNWSRRDGQSMSQSTTMVISYRSVNNGSRRDGQSMSQSTTMVMLWRSVNNRSRRNDQSMSQSTTVVMSWRSVNNYGHVVTVTQYSS